MHAILTPIPPDSWECRVGEETDEYGKAFDVCVIVAGKPPACEVRGLDKPLKPSHWRAIRAVLTAAGYTAAKIVRRRGGVVRVRTITITKGA